jgi:hypothetical protein
MAPAGRSPRPTGAALCLPPYRDKCHRYDVRVPANSPGDPQLGNAQTLGAGRMPLAPPPVAITEQTSSAARTGPGEVRTDLGRSKIIPAGVPKAIVRGLGFELHEKAAPGEEGGRPSVLLGIRSCHDA